MSIFENLNRVLEQARSGNASESDLHTAYDHVSQTSPQSVKEGLADAFRSDQTPSFGQMVANLFGRSDPNQKAGLLNTILSRLHPNDRKEALGTANAGTGVGSDSVTPEQAQQIQPQQVESLAANAEHKDPSIVDQAAAFYAQHPTLVKGLGAAALTVLLSRASRGRL